MARTVKGSCIQGCPERKWNRSGKCRGAGLLRYCWRPIIWRAAIDKCAVNGDPRMVTGRKRTALRPVAGRSPVPTDRTGRRRGRPATSTARYLYRDRIPCRGSSVTGAEGPASGTRTCPATTAVTETWTAQITTAIVVRIVRRLHRSKVQLTVRRTSTNPARTCTGHVRPVPDGRTDTGNKCLNQRQSYS